MTKEELKHNFLKSVIDLRNKGFIEQDSLLDVFENVIEPYISKLEKENVELKKDKEDLIFVRNAKADHICELKDKIADIKANCDFALEGKDVEIKELKEVLKGLLEEEEKGLWFKADGSDKSRYYKLREKAEKILER